MRSLQFAEKFPDIIKDKKQLQRFLRRLNYVSDFFLQLKQLCVPLYKRLRKKPIPWTDTHTNIVKQIKQKIKSLPCLGILYPSTNMIVEIDASDVGYGGILKQKLHDKEQLVCYKIILLLKRKFYLLVCSKFQDDLFFKKFLLCIDCKSTKEVLQKDVKNLVSKQIFVRWQAILSVFDFEIDFIKGEGNSIPNFLTREFLKGKGDNTQFLPEAD